MNVALFSLLDMAFLMEFQVNTSGQFVGVAEMTGAVDFEKTLEYWQQDKWNGSFSLKWHIVKDVPNNMLKHIILENNENKPVTNSRDTQEVIILQTSFHWLAKRVVFLSSVGQFFRYTLNKAFRCSRYSRSMSARPPSWMTSPSMKAGRS
jgi:hypothetical protein